jgi:hypothetical protein
VKSSVKLLLVPPPISIGFTQAHAYLLQKLGYDNLFARTETVVIATPLASAASKVQLQFDQSEYAVVLITTIDTRFKIAFFPKVKINYEIIRSLHF